MHFLSEKMKSTLQSKQSDQFQTLRLTYVVVVVSGFRCEWFLPNTFFLFPRKAEKVWNWREKCRWAAKKTKANGNIDCFSLIKGQGKVREFVEWQPCISSNSLLQRLPINGSKPCNDSNVLNPLSPNSEQHQFSPDNIRTLSRDMVMRINKMITREKMPWSLNKFSQLIL